MRASAVENAAVVFILVALVALLACAFLAPPAHADANAILRAYVGANGAWFSGADPYQADAELTGNLSASLSPHVSLVGGTAWGLCNSYLRAAAGVRVTATDVDNPDFSVALGLQYRVASKAALRPNEWAPDVSVGWRPLPDRYPSLSLVGQGYYGLDTHRAGATVGIRWRFSPFGGLARYVNRNWIG